MQCEFAPGKEKLRSMGIFGLTFSTKPPTFEDLPTGFAESLQQVVLINTCSFVNQAVVALFHIRSCWVLGLLQRCKNNVSLYLHALSHATGG